MGRRRPLADGRPSDARATLLRSPILSTVAQRVAKRAGDVQAQIICGGGPSRACDDNLMTPDFHSYFGQIADISTLF